MSQLEELTLDLFIENRDTIVDGTHLHDEILLHMPQLKKFIFHICTDCEDIDLSNQLSCNDIQQTFDKIGKKQVACILNSIVDECIGHVFSLPFSFDRLQWIGNTFPDIIFHFVVFLKIHEVNALQHEFFLRLARSFPLLNELHVTCFEPQTWNRKKFHYDNDQSYSIIEFPRLTSLNLFNTDADYLEQFLNKKKTHVPRLIELTPYYSQLLFVMKNFTRESTQHTCAQIQRLILQETIVHTKDFYLYFSLI